MHQRGLVGVELLRVAVIRPKVAKAGRDQLKGFGDGARA